MVNENQNKNENKIIDTKFIEKLKNINKIPLYNTYSNKIGDTCTGTNNISCHEGTIKEMSKNNPIGYILESPIENKTKPLYYYFNKKIIDSCTGTEDTKCHDGNLKTLTNNIPIGYILKSPIINQTIPLYQAYSTKGQDTCTGTKDLFCHYNNVEVMSENKPIGYIFKIDYTNNEGKCIQKCKASQENKCNEQCKEQDDIKTSCIDGEETEETNSTSLTEKTEKTEEKSNYLWINYVTFGFFIIMHIILNLNYYFLEIPYFKGKELDNYYYHIDRCIIPPYHFISLSGDQNTKYGKYLYGILFIIFSISTFISNYVIWKKIEKKLSDKWKKIYYPIYLILSGLSSLCWILQSTLFLFNMEDMQSKNKNIHTNLAMIATIIELINLIILLICLKLNKIISIISIVLLIIIPLILGILRLLSVPFYILPTTLFNIFCLNGVTGLVLLFVIYLIKHLIIPLLI